MSPSKSPKPLWLRATKEPAAAKFLKRHRDEFPTKSLMPDPIEFGQRRKHANENIAHLMAESMSIMDAEQRKLAKLFLQMPPRDIAETMGWDRKQTYLRIRALKRFVLDRLRREKEALILGREGLQNKPIDVQKANRRVKFTFLEQEKSAYLVKDSTTWVDEHGYRFPKPIQDILNELDEHKDAFEVLDAEG